MVNFPAAKVERNPVIWFWRGFYATLGKMEPPETEARMTDLARRLYMAGVRWAKGVDELHFRVSRREAKWARERMSEGSINRSAPR